MTSILVSAPIVPGVAFAVAFPIIFLAFACVFITVSLTIAEKKPLPTHFRNECQCFSNGDSPHVPPIAKCLL